MTISINSLTRYLVALTVLIAALTGCSSNSVSMIHPQSGATADCSASGFGIGASFSDGFVSGCGRAYEERGYVSVERLTPEQRTNRERRGLMPKN